MVKKYLTKKSSYFYHLPSELIAQYPKDRRDESLLLCLERDSSKIEHTRFNKIVKFFQKGDVLVLNKTKVIPARLHGCKPTGAKVEVFLLNQKSINSWECLVKPGRKLKVGAEVKFAEDFTGKIIDYTKEGARIVKFNWQGKFWDNLEKYGEMPLPPYIKREAEDSDKQSYQTVYAQKRGSVAAPTAGLHFTQQILDELQTKGVEIVEVILDVGLGTFRPVKSDDIQHHKMHSEHCQISEETAKRINIAKDEGRRIIAVGTTSTRTLESFAQNGRVRAGSHWTDIFIYPGKKIQIIDALLTNFHMPQSTLLMLVAAFAGYENIMTAYKIAVEKKYRFFSYGDAMLII
ncbi:MAG: tRNA preQ1(34) S-adenosylmethionine ribosyltransferase-isomerase QueA [Candidatus Cloacimonadota bacterium]|nr:tRNA preQ1(34) S-adenosylmethionine ribosyltransferase-isomerase QueA [Candidatus Cloacimonadota bacterium]